MTISNKDRNTIRDLAKQYLELCEGDRNQALIADWRRLNNMEPCRPMIKVNDNLLGEEIAPHMPDIDIEDDLIRNHARGLSRQINWTATLGDDQIFNPWITIPAPRLRHPEGQWGVEPNMMRDESSRGWRHLPVVESLEDLKKLKATEHKVLDPDPPRAQRLRDLIGDILPVRVARNTVYGVWGGTDLSEAAGALLGLEELMMALYTDPEMVRELMAFMRDAVINNLKQGEAAGDWGTPDSNYYLTPALCEELPDPAADSYGVSLKELAWFFHAQEFEGVSPEMFEEFLFDYQLPIMELFGRVTYGCCETLDGKLDVLKRLPNMKKVLSGPRSDPACYPDVYGKQCVISWRPVTTIIASEHFDEDAQRAQIREGVSKLSGCNIEIHMHEPMTVHGDLGRIKKWVAIARDEAEGWK